MKPKAIFWIPILSIGWLAACRSDLAPAVFEGPPVDATPLFESTESVEVPPSLEGPSIIEETGIVYANVQGVELKLDLFRPAGDDGPLPVIIFMFGGGWFEGGRAAFWGQSRLAAQRGYVAVPIDYRLTDELDANSQPKYPWPAQIHDVKCAVRWLRSNAERLNIDPGRIGAAGYSAGGHLALMLALTDPSDGLEGDCGDLSYSSRIQAAVSLAGPMDLAYAYDPGTAYGRLAYGRLLGGNPEEKPKEYRSASPIFYGSHDDPPVLTVLGERDADFTPQNGERFDASMSEAGAFHTLIIIEGEGHSYFGGTWPDLYEIVFEFFDRHLDHVD